MSRRRLLREYDSAELSEWLAYERAFDLPDGYLVAGVVAPAVAAAMGCKPVPTAADYLPYYDAQAKQSKRGRRMTGDEMKRNFAAHTKGPTGRV